MPLFNRGAHRIDEWLVVAETGPAAQTVDVTLEFLESCVKPLLCGLEKDVDLLVLLDPAVKMM